MQPFSEDKKHDIAKALQQAALDIQIAIHCAHSKDGSQGKVDDKTIAIAWLNPYVKKRPEQEQAAATQKVWV